MTPPATTQAVRQMVSELLIATHYTKGNSLVFAVDQWLRAHISAGYPLVLVTAVADELRNQHKLDQAFTLYLALIGKGIDDPYWYQQIGVCCYMQRQWLAAIGHLRNALVVHAVWTYDSPQERALTEARINLDMGYSLVYLGLECPEKDDPGCVNEGLRLLEEANRAINPDFPAHGQLADPAPMHLHARCEIEVGLARGDKQLINDGLRHLENALRTCRRHESRNPEELDTVQLKTVRRERVLIHLQLSRLRTKAAFAQGGLLALAPALYRARLHALTALVWSRYASPAQTLKATVYMFLGSTAWDYMQNWRQR